MDSKPLTYCLIIMMTGLTFGDDSRLQTRVKVAEGRSELPTKEMLSKLVSADPNLALEAVKEAKESGDLKTLRLALFYPATSVQIPATKGLIEKLQTTNAEVEAEVLGVMEYENARLIQGGSEADIAHQELMMSLAKALEAASGSQILLPAQADEADFRAVIEKHKHTQRTTTGAAPNQSQSKTATSAVIQQPKSERAPDVKPTFPTPIEEPPSSTPWSIIVVLIVAALGLLWLLLKRRS